MSLVHLSSIGQRPNSFYNQFPNGIQLGTNASVCLVGYSGQLDGEVDPDTGEVFSITVNKDQNDTFIVQHADLDIATGTGKGLAYPPQTVVVPAGLYTPITFGVALQVSLNNSERFFQYKGVDAWKVVYNAAAAPPAPIYSYTITCSKRRASGAVLGGDFISYGGGTTGVTGGGLAPSVLTSYQSPISSIGSFIDTELAFIGDCTQAIGTAGATAPIGMIMEFTSIGGTVAEDIGYSLCYVARRNATKMDLLNSVTGKLGYSTSSVPDPDNDFAYGPAGNQSYGYCPHGLTIRNDGQIGIIEAITGNITGDNKAPNNWNVTWTAANINLAAPGLKKLGMSPRYDGVNKYPVMEYLYWNAATWISLGTREIDGPRLLPGGLYTTYQYDQRYYAGVVVDPITATRATSLPVTLKKSVAIGAGDLEPDEPITFAFEPYDNETSLNYLVSSGGMESAARKANHLGESCGFPQQQLANTATMSSVGISSSLSLGKLLTNGDYSSLLITCPSLPITGYIGGAIGTTSPLLAVGRVNGNSLQYGFSGETAENWIELRNTRPLTLYRLKIDIKTDTNHDYLGLEPNFSVWIKFKSNTDHLHLTSPDVMGVITN